MEKRFLVKANGHWRIRTEAGKIKKEERIRLREYLNEIRFPYRHAEGEICIPESIGVVSLHEAVAHFYDGEAAVQRL
jgi:hypothetical protein